jgi:hypothetical protein
MGQIYRQTMWQAWSRAKAGHVTEVAAGGMLGPLVYAGMQQGGVGLVVGMEQGWRWWVEVGCSAWSTLWFDTTWQVWGAARWRVCCHHL